MEEPKKLFPAIDKMPHFSGIPSIRCHIANTGSRKPAGIVTNDYGLSRTLVLPYLTHNVSPSQVFRQDEAVLTPTARATDRGRG